MGTLLTRLPDILNELKANYPILECKAANFEANATGHYTLAISGAKRLFGVASYCLQRRVADFKVCLADSVMLQLEVVGRYERGDPIPKSFVSMLLYQSLFDALAAGDLTLSRKMASAMGGRDEIEKEHDHPFDFALGYTLKHFTLEDHLQMAHWSAEFTRICAEPENADFRGYAEAFEAIFGQANQNFNSAFQNIIKGHKRQSKGSGVFRDTDDELLCVWGIGLANLAKHLGLEVKVDDPLVPAALIQGLQ